MSGKSLAIYSIPRLNKSPSWDWAPAGSHTQICLQLRNLEIRIWNLEDTKLYYTTVIYNMLQFEYMQGLRIEGGG